MGNVIAISAKQTQERRFKFSTAAAVSAAELTRLTRLAGAGTFGDSILVEDVHFVQEAGVFLFKDENCLAIAASALRGAGHTVSVDGDVNVLDSVSPGQAYVFDMFEVSC